MFIYCKRAINRYKWYSGKCAPSTSIRSDGAIAAAKLIHLRIPCEQLKEVTFQQPDTKDEVSNREDCDVARKVPSVITVLSYWVWCYVQTHLRFIADIITIHLLPFYEEFHEMLMNFNGIHTHTEQFFLKKSKWTNSVHVHQREHCINITTFVLHFMKV